MRSDGVLDACRLSGIGVGAVDFQTRAGVDALRRTRDVDFDSWSWLIGCCVASTILVTDKSGSPKGWRTVRIACAACRGGSFMRVIRSADWQMTRNWRGAPLRYMNKLVSEERILLRGRGHLIPATQYDMVRYGIRSSSQIIGG
ncbi:MAG: hypothetical protein QOK37_890 [Thermoanaerobaculia bacterium]|nr:hypothetical protein [Thermoanaerobaculia bacterium]